MSDKKLVMVEWEDACMYVSRDLDEVLEKPDIVQTFGILIHQDNNYHIVMTHSGGPESSDHMKIPSSLVRQVKELRTI